jgi:ADP-heptose:LPS heptosyltransferase
LSIVKKTRKKAGEYFLRKEFANISRTIAVTNFEEAETIALIFDATDKEEFEVVKKYIKKLKENKRKVRAIGFYDGKEEPVLMSSKLEYDFFSRKQLKWNFMQEPFDLLINLCMNFKTPLLYVTALSRAKFKVGRQHTQYEPYYDLLLNVEDGTGLKNFIAVAEKYLSMIQPKK